MNETLPQGWAHSPVEQVFRSFGGGTPNKGTPAYWKGSIPWLSSGDIKTERIHSASEFITKGGLENSSANLCRPGSVLVVVRSGVLKHTLPVAVLEREAAINQDIKCFDSGCSELNEWLSLALRASANDILALNREGTTVQSVKYETLKEFDLSIPPLAEQKRIVAKLEMLLGQVDSCQQQLARIPKLLKRFRQSVLAAACSGRLTADWRVDNGSIQDATELLCEIKARRMARYETDCASAKKRGQKVPKLEWNDDNPDFSGYDLPELPDTWEWTHVAKFGFVKGGKRLPKGVGLVEENTGHPYLRIRDLKNGTVDHSEILYVPKHVFPSIRNYTIQHGDVYLTIVGSIGESGTIPRDLDGASLTENAAKIVQPVGLVPEFLAIWFRSSICQQIIRQNIHSGGQGKLALFRIEQMPAPLVPLPEQQEIVRRAENLFALADRLEARLEEGRKRVDSISQAILAKAFRGELVPTEFELAKAEGRSFESAEELLERVKGNSEEPAKKRVKRSRRSNSRI